MIRKEYMAYFIFKIVNILYKLANLLNYSFFLFQNSDKSIITKNNCFNKKRENKYFYCTI